MKIKSQMSYKFDCSSRQQFACILIAVVNGQRAVNVDNNISAINSATRSFYCSPVSFTILPSLPLSNFANDLSFIFMFIASGLIVNKKYFRL